MRIRAIRLRNVRRFGSEGIAIEDLGPGLNVLTAPNEYGKSTILDAVKTALFVKDSAQDKATNSLRPSGDDGHPYVELEFATDEGQFELTKRFARGRKDSATRLDGPGGTLLGDEADSRLRSLLGTEKAAAGPTGLLWISQGEGLRGIVTADKQALSGDQVSTISGLLETEVRAAGESGDTRGVVEAAQAELRKLETPAGTKSAGQLAAAEARVAALASDRDDLRAQVTRGARLRTELREKEEARRLLADPEEEARRREAIAAAETRAREGELLRTQSGHTKAEIERDSADIKRETLALQTFDTSAKRLKDCDKEAGMAADRSAQIAEERGMAESERTALRERRAGLQDRRKALRRDLDRWQKVLAAKARDEERSRLEKLLASAETWLAEVKGLEPVAARQPIDLQKLRDAQKAVDSAEAKLSAGAPELMVEAGGPVELDGATLSPGERAAVTGEGQISVGTTRLRLLAPGREALAAKARSARDRLNRLLSETNVSSVDEALRTEAERQQATDRLKALRQTIRDVAPDGIDALRDRLAALCRDEDTPETPEHDAADLEQQLSAAEKEEEELAQAEAQLSERLDRLAGEKRDADVVAETARREKVRLEQELGPEDARAERREAIEKAIAEINGRLAGHQHRLNQIAEALKDVSRAEAEAKRLRTAEENERRKLQRIGEEIARMGGELKAFYAEGAEAELTGIEEELAAAEAERDRLQARRQALRLLLSMIAEEEALRRDTIVAPVMQRLEPMLEQVFGDAQLRFDAEWNPEELRRPGEVAAVADLSTGTREQVAVLVRLALAKLMAERGQPLPVILDDALTYSDDQRARRLFGVIHEVAEMTQVIVLSCHERLFGDLGGKPIEPKPFAAD